MNDEKLSTGQNDTKSDPSEAKTSQERITIRRGPGYVPGQMCIRDSGGRSRYFDQRFEDAGIAETVSTGIIIDAKRDRRT